MLQNIISSFKRKKMELKIHQQAQNLIFKNASRL
jgi:hypothetical protein